MSQRHSAQSGQSTAEYAVVIALVLGAIVGMQTYVKRAINARIADASDKVLPTNLGPADAAGRTQFEPDYAKSKSTTRSTLTSGASGVVVTGAIGAASTVTVADGFTSSTDRTGSEQGESASPRVERGK